MLFLSYHHHLFIMFTCQNCQAEFQTRNEYSSHKRMCVESTKTFQLNGEQITVRKNGEGKFACYCSHSGCGTGSKTYQNTYTLSTHMKKVGSHWVGPAEVSR